MRSGLFAGLALCAACTANTAPIARTTAIDRDVSVDSIAYVTGVHLAALPLSYPYTIFPMALNDWGEVVGTYDQNTFTNAFKWQGSRGLTVLSLPNGLQSQARGVNDSGQVAITIDSAVGATAAIWGWFGQVKYLRELSTYNSTACGAIAINNHGIVLGQCTMRLGGAGCANPSLPTLWTTFGTPYAFHPGGGSAVFSGEPTPVFTDAGYAAGLYFPDPCGSNANHAFVFNAATKTLTMLPDLVINGVDYSSEANAVNDSGYAVGDATTNQPNCSSHAVVWLAGGQPQDLGICGVATGITDDGIVIGNFATGDSAFAFVWTAATGVQRLPHLYPENGTSPGAPLPHETSTAIAINRVHQILGTASNVAETSPPTRTAVIWTLPASFVASGSRVARR